jgi:hypothetical protein
MPLKGAELVGKRHSRVNFVDTAVNLQAIVIDDSDEVIQVVVAGEHGRLPHLALLALAVAQQRVDAVAVTPALCGECHSNRGGDTLTERSGRHVDARRVIHIGMALQAAADTTERLELLLGKEPALGEHGIERRSAVSLGEHKAIALGAARIRRVDIHFLKVEVGHNVGGAKRSARMPRLGGVNRSHDTLPDLIGDLRQFLVGHTNSSLENNPGTG